MVTHGPNAGVAYPVESDTIYVGRDPGSDIRLRHETISRSHAKLAREGEAWFVTDLHSSNGTRLNGDRIDHERVEHMDELQFGEVTVLFMDDAPALLEGEASRPEITQVLDTSTMEMLWTKEAVGREAGEAEFRRGMAALLRLSNEVGACRSVPELMAKVSLAASEALRSDRIVPVTVEADGRLRPWYGRSSAAHAVLAELPISTSVVDHVRKQREAVISEVQADERFQSSASVVRHEIAAAMCVPLVSGGDELGVIYADRVAPAEPFVRTDLEMLAAMAMPVVVALENIRFAERLKREREQLVNQMRLEHNIIGRHESVQVVLNLVERVAGTDSNVLIVGESGTGKELVARAIHYNSGRSGGAFEVVNCAAMAPTLLESELFGHVKGAFTGAVQDKPGRFELADKGTLFLDEIGELPLESQAKLLRVIEQGELRRVGDTRDRHVDVRILAATNRKLDDLTARGKFRDDLFYRLNIVRVDFPPLRARGDDVDLLADHFLGYFCAKCDRPPLRLSGRARELLRKYPWPGNVRELKNVMERMAVTCGADEVKPDDLPPEVCVGRAPKEGDATVSLADIEREHVIRVLGHTGGNKKEAAAILGIDRSTLYAKLKHYGIE